jgi:hypothetical protein
MFIEGLYSYLSSYAGLKSILGTTRGDGTTGIFAQLAPATPTIPYIVYTQMSSHNVQSYAGAGRLTFARFRFSCYASGYLVAKQLAEQLRQSFATYTGTLTDGTILEDALLLLEVDDSEPAGAHGTIHAAHLDYEFNYVNES